MVFFHSLEIIILMENVLCNGSMLEVITVKIILVMGNWGDARLEDWSGTFGIILVVINFILW